MAVKGWMDGWLGFNMVTWL